MLGIVFMISNISVACFTLPTSEAVFMAREFLFCSSVILWIKSEFETVLISTLLKSLVWIYLANLGYILIQKSFVVLLFCSNSCIINSFWVILP